MFDLLTGGEALLLSAAGALVGAVLAFRFGSWPSTGARAAGAIAAAFAGSALLVAPVTSWQIVADLRAAKRLSAREAERIGPEENGVDTSLTDRITPLIPHHATYAVTFSARLDPDRASVFRVWSLSALLPRRAVTDLSSSDWIVSWGVAPDDLEVSVADVHVIEPRDDSDPPVYVARVVG